MIAPHPDHPLPEPMIAQAREETQTMKRNVRNVDQERREAANQEWVADPEEQILHALAQVRVVEGLLLAEAEINGGSPIGSEGVASAACRLMG